MSLYAMDQDSANLDLSSSQPAYLHEAVPAGDGAANHVLNHGGSPAAKLGKQTPNAIDDFPIAPCHWPAHRLHLDSGFPPPSIYTYPTDSLFGTVYDAPTGFCDPNYGWPNVFDPVGISGYDYTNPVPNMPSNSLTAIGVGAFTQGFNPTGTASHGPYNYGHSQPTIAALPLTHAVDQTSNTFDYAGPVQTRPICMQCGRDFGRQSDLDRHMKKHQPNAQVFRCQVQGCQYSSKRKDKLMEHSRRPH